MQVGRLTDMEPRETEMRANPHAMLILTKFTEWWNLWAKKDATPTWNPPPLEVKNFFDYDQTRIVSSSVVEEEGTMTVVVSAGYGDDGGNSLLTGQFIKWPWVENSEWGLQWIIQIFDTGTTLIWSNNYETGTFEFLLSDEKIEDAGVTALA